jgi:acyl-coenzyme A synthetase/AMP-(fatty) acid ligase
MQIISEGMDLKYSHLVEQYKHTLRQETLILDSDNHLEHIAAYVAWMEVGGRIMVIGPPTPVSWKEALKNQLQNDTKTDCIFLHTSGTTGMPKLVSFNKQEYERIIAKSELHLDWSKDTSWLNFIPPYTSGFWHIVLPLIVKYNCKIILSTRKTMKEDFASDVNSTLIVPGLIDQMRIAKLQLPLEKFNIVATGASQVLPRHVEYIFQNNCKVFNHCYGTTEIGSPVLGHRTYSIDESNCWLEVDRNCEIVNNELIYNGIPTADLFEVKENFIRFTGRSNDIVKLNGFQCSLLLIENSLEELGLGDCLAVPHNKAGSDYIELFHTDGSPNKKELKEILTPLLPPCNIPLKYTKTDSIPRNALNKKVRNAVQADT